jgi:hypothetical protein
MVMWYARPGGLPCKKNKEDLVERYNLTKERDEFDCTSLRTNEVAVTEEVLSLLRASEGNPNEPYLQPMGPKTIKTPNMLNKQTTKGMAKTDETKKATIRAPQRKRPARHDSGSNSDSSVSSSSLEKRAPKSRAAKVRTTFNPAPHKKFSVNKGACSDSN